MTTKTTTLVTEVHPAASAEALAHFESLLEFEADCWDVHESMKANGADFVLLDVRGIGGFNADHVAGAVHFPHKELTAENLGDYPVETVFVVYCAGPHCNGADKAAVKLAGLGRPVKKMIGGIEGWKDEGFPLEVG